MSRVIVTAPAANKIAAARSPASTRHAAFSIRRRHHSRNVVTSTAAQEGCVPGRLAGGQAACRGAGTAPGLVAGTEPGRVAGTPPGRAAWHGTGPSAAWLGRWPLAGGNAWQASGARR